MWNSKIKILGTAIGVILFGSAVTLGANHANQSLVQDTSTKSIITSSPTPSPTLTPTVTPTPTTYAAPTRSTSQIIPPMTSQNPGLSNNNYYINSSGNNVHSPAYSNNGSVPAGATAQCSDGTYSFSQSSRGTCSHHGGVVQWL